MHRRLKSFKRFFVFLLISFVYACQPEDKPRVVGVKDGDTIVILTPDHQNITVRLAEVDCPEKSQAYGQAAKQFTSNLCFGKSVRLEGNEHDRYGRTIAKVILDDGRIVNYELVKNGYAWHYTQYSNNALLDQYQQQARESRLGLWQDANPTPPWEYRKHSREHRQNNNPYHRKHKRRKTDFEFTE